MPVTENMSCWECDRCDGREAADGKIYAAGAAPSGWERVSYAYDDGTDRAAVLGPACAEEYHAQRRICDSTITAFFNAYKKKGK